MPRSRTTTVTGSPAGASETVIATLSGLVLPYGDIIDIEATCDVTIGTSGVSATLKLERGSAAGGTIIATIGPCTVVAANRYNFAIQGTDSQSAEFSGGTYVLTLTVGSGAATSTVNNVNMTAIY